MENFSEKGLDFLSHINYNLGVAESEVSQCLLWEGQRQKIPKTFGIVSVWMLILKKSYKPIVKKIKSQREKRYEKEFICF